MSDNFRNPVEVIQPKELADEWKVDRYHMSISLSPSRESVNEVTMYFTYIDPKKEVRHSVSLDFFDVACVPKNAQFLSFMQHYNIGVLCAWQYWRQKTLSESLYRRIKTREEFDNFRMTLQAFRVELPDTFAKPRRR